MFIASKRVPTPRLRAVHDYTRQWPGHKVIRGEMANPVFVTGVDLRQGDIIVLPEGRMLIAECAGHRDSDLFLFTLEAVP